MAQRSSELVSKVSLKPAQDACRQECLNFPAVSGESSWLCPCRIDICRGDGAVYGKIVEHEQPQKSQDEAGRLVCSHNVTKWYGSSRITALAV